mmetsp:Transcript_90929/g.180786  ORF Transcript_90929/g.180786 Transcript_90929/m.180786 type:complete len:153 (-) Transcript_90929:679-1137(-)
MLHRMSRQHRQQQQQQQRQQALLENGITKRGSPSRNRSSTNSSNRTANAAASQGHAPPKKGCSRQLGQEQQSSGSGNGQGNSSTRTASAVATAPLTAQHICSQVSFDQALGFLQAFFAHHHDLFLPGPEKSTKPWHLPMKGRVVPHTLLRKC